MGFSEIRCQRGLLATGNGGVEEAMNWLFEHMDDPGMFRSSHPILVPHSLMHEFLATSSDIDKPLSAAQPAASAEPTPEQINMVMEMGFSVPQSRKALLETVSFWNVSCACETGLISC
jgi:ubiquitin carboxyl-terminal hydrolase 5/13